MYFLDKAITVIKKGIKTENYQDKEVEISRRVVDAKESSIFASEFYKAAESKIKPKKTFIFNLYDFDGEEEFIDEEGRHYTYIREYITSYQGVPYIEVTVEEKISDGAKQ